MNMKFLGGEAETPSATLLMGTKRAWSEIFSIPGLPMKQKQKRTVIVGGPLFLLIVGLFRFMLYLLVLWYALIVILFRLVVALLATLVWGIAVAVEALQRRRGATSVEK